MKTPHLKKALIGGAVLALGIFALPTIAKARIPQHFAVQDPAFTVSMPAQPEKTEKQLPTKSGALPTTEYLANKDGVAYLAMHTDYRTTPAHDYTRLRNSALKEMNGAKVLAEDSVTVNGVAGHYFKAANAKGEILVDYYFFSGKRLYQLLVVVPSGQSVPYEVDAFVQSFRLLS